MRNLQKNRKRKKAYIRKKRKRVNKRKELKKFRKFMNINNGGFFLPTVMVFIMIFLLLILFIGYEGITYLYMIDAYENEVYEEVGLVKAKEIIRNDLEENNEYDDVCDSKLNTKNSYVNISINKTCLILSKKIPKNYNLLLSNEKMELTDLEYKNLQNKIKLFSNNESKLKKKVKKKIKKILKELEYTQLEIMVIDKVIQKIKDILSMQYIAYDIKISYNNNSEQVLYLYNYEGQDIKSVKHT